MADDYEIVKLIHYYLQPNLQMMFVNIAKTFNFFTSEPVQQPLAWRLLNKTEIWKKFESSTPNRCLFVNAAYISQLTRADMMHLRWWSEDELNWHTPLRSMGKCTTYSSRTSIEKWVLYLGRVIFFSFQNSITLRSVITNDSNPRDQICAGT